jgi:hypothetical protein
MALALLGLALALYAVASLTGGWLGEPPWWEASWEQVVPPTKMNTHSVAVEFRGGPGYVDSSEYDVEIVKWTPTLPRPGREVISAVVAALGLALFAWAAWPRLRARSASCPGSHESAGANSARPDVPR